MNKIDEEKNEPIKTEIIFNAPISFNLSKQITQKTIPTKPQIKESNIFGAE